MKFLKLVPIFIISIMVFGQALIFGNAYAATTPCGSGTVIDYSDCLPHTKADHSTLAFILALTFAIVGLIAVLIIVLAGFKFITSSGKPEEIAKAKDTIIYAAVGLIVCAAAVTIISFIVGYI